MHTPWGAPLPKDKILHLEQQLDAINILNIKLRGGNPDKFFTRETLATDTTHAVGTTAVSGKNNAALTNGGDNVVDNSRSKTDVNVQAVELAGLDLNLVQHNIILALDDLRTKEEALKKNIEEPHELPLIEGNSLYNLEMLHDLISPLAQEVHRLANATSGSAVPAMRHEPPTLHRSRAS